MKIKIAVLVILLLTSSVYFHIISKDVDLHGYNEYILDNITLITMINENDVFKGSIHIKNGKILDVYSSEINIPSDIKRVDMNGKYIIPGLSDMHVHNMDVESTTKFLAYGVTHVRVMCGSEMHLVRRESIETMRILGPEMIVGSMLIDGPNPYHPNLSIVVENVEDVRPLLLELKKKGYDFIKTYDNLSVEVFDEIMKVSKEISIPVAGHIPKAVNVEDASGSGLISSEHLFGHDVGQRNPSKLKKEIDIIVDHGMWISPTPYVYNMNYVDITPQNGMDYWEILNYIESFNNSGGKIVLGTDESGEYVEAGISLLESLEMLTEANLTSYEALKTATVNPAEMLGLDMKFGRIKKGLDADLVILNSNPLDDISNIYDINAVITKGRYLNYDWIIENK